MARDTVRITYPFRARFIWFVSSAILPFLSGLILIFFAVSAVFWPVWKWVPITFTVFQFFGFLFEIGKGVQHYTLLRNATNAVSDFVDDQIDPEGTVHERYRQ